MNKRTANRIIHRRQAVNRRLHYPALAVVLAGLGSLNALAQEVQLHTAQHQLSTTNQQSQSNALVQVVRQATERFKDVTVAEKEGYAATLGCVTGPDAGAMGLHYVNGNLVKSGIIDATRPQAVIYEPQPDGSLRLVGVEYIAIAAPWDAKKEGPPVLLGQLFHYFDSPNRFGLDAFYGLHVWAWKDNPNGAFVNWHPNVSCLAFNPE
jgi:hypothetical protein